MASSNASYLLRSQAKCLVPHTAEQERHSFLVGTSNLRGPNDIRVLRYYEDEDELDCVASYAHEGEVSSMSACPHDAAVVMTTSTTSEGLPCASIYRMHDLPGDAEDEERYLAGEEGGVADPAERKRTLEKLVALPSQRPGCRLLQVQFVPAEGSSLMGGDEGGNTAAASGGVESCKVLAVDDTSLRLFTLTNDGSLKLSLKLDGGGEMVTEDATFIGGIAWDALNYGTAAIAHDSTVSFWDTRSGDRTRVIERAVPAGCVVRGLSFNPNKPWHVATGGDDYQVKIWDTRKAASGPVKVLQGHTHG